MESAKGLDRPGSSPLAMTSPPTSIPTIKSILFFLQNSLRSLAILAELLKMLTNKIFSFNTFAEHDVCIAIYPTPPECLHEEEKNNNDNLLIGTVLLVGGYYLFKDGGNESTTLDASSGINLYTRGEFKLNFLEINKNYVYLENLETNKIQVNLLSFNYQFK